MLISDLDFFILEVHVISRVLHTIFSSSQIMVMFIKSPRLCAINNSTPLLWNFFFWIKRDFRVPWEPKKKNFPRLHFCWDDAVRQFLGGNGYHLNITLNITNTIYGQILLGRKKKEKKNNNKNISIGSFTTEKNPNNNSYLEDNVWFWSSGQRNRLF